MKLINKLFLLIGLSGLCSCDSYLDKMNDDPLTLESVFLKRATTEQYLWNVYSFIPDERGTDMTGTSTWAATTDEAIYCYANAGFTLINNGSWNVSSSPGDGNWYTYYQGIREANIFRDAILNKRWCPETIIPWDEQEKMANEARFLRAYYYFLLMRQYGPVVLMYDEIMDLTEPDTKKLEKTRNTWDECVDYVTSELEAVVPLLEEKQTEQWLGKPTKAAALAIKARLLLYSARPLFNGNKDYSNSSLFSSQYDANKWKLAAAANKAVIDTFDGELVVKMKVNEEGNQVIDPNASIYAMITEPWNSELIWARRLSWGKIQYDCIPTGVRGTTTYGGISPTQQMVDAYAMNNGIYPIVGHNTDGSPIYAGNKGGYSESGFSNFTHPIEKKETRTFNMYINREPRFYATVLWSGAYWINAYPKNLIVEFFRQGNSGLGTANDYSKGGYLLRKFVDRNRDHSLTHYTSWGYISIPIFRLAEIYLNYCEALIETDLNNPDLFYYWNKVRQRAGVPNIEAVYPEAVGNKEKLLELLKRERQVELAFEGHRYFDVRFWKEGEKYFAGPMYGMNYTADNHDENGEFWKRTPVEVHIFRNKHYLYPIKQKELDRNKLLEQNPYW